MMSDDNVTISAREPATHKNFWNKPIKSRLVKALFVVLSFVVWVIASQIGKFTANSIVPPPASSTEAAINQLLETGTTKRETVNYNGQNIDSTLEIKDHKSVLTLDLPNGTPYVMQVCAYAYGGRLHFHYTRPDGSTFDYEPTYEQVQSGFNPLAK